MDYVILTRRGWLNPEEVQVGDETIGYNRTTAQSGWTRITRLVHYSDAPLVRLYNSRWVSVATPNHCWLNLPRITEPRQLIRENHVPCAPGLNPLHCVNRWQLARNAAGRRGQLARTGSRFTVPASMASPRPPKIERRVQRGATTKGGLRVHLAIAHGIWAEKQRTGYATEASWVTAETIRPRDRLLLAAPALMPGLLPVSDQEAAILGWVAGDGHVCSSTVTCHAAVSLRR